MGLVFVDFMGVWVVLVLVRYVGVAVGGVLSWCVGCESLLWRGLVI